MESTPPPTVFCPLLKKSSYNPYLKFLDFYIFLIFFYLMFTPWISRIWENILQDAWYTIDIITSLSFLLSGPDISELENSF